MRWLGFLPSTFRRTVDPLHTQPPIVKTQAPARRSLRFSYGLGFLVSFGISLCRRLFVGKSIPGGEGKTRFLFRDRTAVKEATSLLDSTWAGGILCGDSHANGRD